jgi:transposase
MFSVGRDVHKDSVTIAVFRNRDAEPMRVDRLANDHKKLHRYFERLAAEGSVRACYEASGAGYVLQRALADWGIACELAAPSLMPTRPGEHRKTDRRDAIKIGQDFRDDRLVLVHIPTEEDERVREEDRIVLAEYFALLEYKLQRRDELDRRIEALALTPRYKPLVDRITCFRGFKTQAAMVLATELGDLSRFENPRQLMAYIGLVPGEHTSGDRRRLGAITKAGNARVRHVLIQAAWSYRRRPTVGAALRRRQEGQDPSVLTHAWKCQHRLYKVFHRLAAKKPKQVAATAVAREMIGFLWAVLRDLDVAQLQHPEVSRAA